MPMMEQLKARLSKYKKWEPFVFFVAGFSFDLVILNRIDDPLLVTQQVLYLFLVALIIAWDVFCDSGVKSEPLWLGKIWKYREGLLHFFLGGLLNVYTIFYFKSGSLINSLIFLLFIGVLLVLNEARPTKIKKPFLRNALFSLCLISFLNIIIPVAAGTIGMLVFMLAVATAYLLHSFFMNFIKKRLPSDYKTFVDFRLPFLLIAALYSGLYILKVLPPVPLSVKHMGIYREIIKEGDSYKLAYTRSPWRFWESGDQTFEAKSGDKIYCFASIYSPTKFEEALTVTWQRLNDQGKWEVTDSIPFRVLGGRVEGFRGYTLKSNYQPGKWRISILTHDRREVGRISLNVIESHDPIDKTRHYTYQ